MVVPIRNCFLRMNPYLYHHKDTPKSLSIYISIYLYLYIYIYYVCIICYYPNNQTPEMPKKCTPLWREAHVEVKMLKTLGVRTTFGRSDVVSRGRRKGLCTLSKVSKT